MIGKKNNTTPSRVRSEVNSLTQTELCITRTEYLSNKSGGKRSVSYLLISDQKSKGGVQKNRSEQKAKRWCVVTDGYEEIGRGK